MQRSLPRLYAMLDAEAVRRRGLLLLHVAEEFRSAGVLLLQYRDKIHEPSEILSNASAIRDIFRGSGCTLLLNDRPDLAVEAGWDGVHVGQSDMAVLRAREIVGQSGWVGISTHTPLQVVAAQETSADYVAIGPVFPTSTKADAEPVIGVGGVRSMRCLTSKPLVGIGGITSANAGSVLAAGADAVAVISALLDGPQPLRLVVRSVLREIG